MTTDNVVQLPTAPPTPADGVTLERRVEQYLGLRSKIEEIEKRHTEELRKFREAREWLEGVLMAALQASGMESVRTHRGTFFRTLHTSAKVVDWNETLGFIRTNEAWDLLEARVSKTAVQAIMEDTKHPVPGVEVTRAYRLNVRSPRETATKQA